MAIKLLEGLSVPIDSSKQHARFLKLSPETIPGKQCATKILTHRPGAKEQEQSPIKKQEKIDKQSAKVLIKHLQESTGISEGWKFYAKHQVILLSSNNRLEILKIAEHLNQKEVCTASVKVNKQTKQPVLK